MAMNVQPPLVSAGPRVDLMFAPPDRETGEIVVWWGLSVVECLSGDRSQVEWKLSAARFYNMGVRHGTRERGSTANTHDAGLTRPDGGV